MRNEQELTAILFLSGTPEIFQALTLRLETQLWMTSKRNFPRLQAIMLGFHAPTDRPALALKVSRAACIRDICHLDPFKGTELVAGIQVKYPADLVSRWSLSMMLLV